MAVSEDLQKKLGKKYESSARVEMKYKGYDLSYKTDEEGNAILLFIGKKTKQGTIKGERYAPHFKRRQGRQNFYDRIIYCHYHRMPITLMTN